MYISHQFHPFEPSIAPVAAVQVETWSVWPAATYLLFCRKLSSLRNHVCTIFHPEGKLQTCVCGKQRRCQRQWKGVSADKIMEIQFSWPIVTTQITYYKPHKSEKAIFQNDGQDYLFFYFLRCDETRKEFFLMRRIGEVCVRYFEGPVKKKKVLTCLRRLGNTGNQAYCM